MTHKQLAVIGAVVLVVAILATGAFAAWLQHHDALLQLNETITTQKEAIKTLQEKSKAREQEGTAAKGDIDQQRAAAKTDPLMAALIARMMNLPQTPTVILPAAPAAQTTGPAPPPQTEAQKLANLPANPTPTADGGLLFSRASVPVMADFAANCKKGQVDLGTCAGTVEDLKGQLKAQKKELDDALGAAGKTGFWARTWRTVKCGAAGGLGAGLGAAAAGGKGAAIGGGAGAGICAAVSK